MFLLPRTAPVLSLCLLAIVAVQTAVSMCSDDPFRRSPATETEMRTCVRNVLGASKSKHPIRAEAIHFACTKVKGITITHYEGNYSISTDQITCDTRPVYSYVIGKTVRRSTEGMVVGCMYRTCVFVALKRDTLYVTGPTTRTSRSNLVLPTTLDPERASKLDLKAIAETLADTFSNAITEEGEVRRRALLGSIVSMCPFPVNVQ